MKKILFVAIFLGLLVLGGEVRSVPNQIAAVELSTTNMVCGTPYVSPSWNSSISYYSPCSSGLVNSYRNYSYYITPYNYSSTIPIFNASRYQEILDERRMWFSTLLIGDPNWTMGYLGFNFSAPDTGVADLFLPMWVQGGGYAENLKYAVYLNGSLILNRSASNSFLTNDTYFIPLNNLTLSQNLSSNGSYLIEIIFDVDRNSIHDNHRWSKKIYWVKRGTAQAPDVAFSYDSSKPYHIVPSLSGTANNTLEVVNITAEINQPDGTNRTVDLSLSGDKWNRTYDQGFYADQAGNYTVTLIAVDSYGYETRKTYQYTITNAPDVIVTDISLGSSSIVVGGSLPISVTVKNNGTSNAVDYVVNLTRRSSIIEINTSQKVNLSVGENKTLIFNWFTSGMGGLHDIYVVLQNTTEENTTDNTLFQQVKVAWNQFYTTNNFSNLITVVEVIDENGTILFNNSTVNWTDDYFNIPFNLNGSWALIKFKYNQTYVDGNSIIITSTKLQWYNESSSTLINLSTGNPSWVNSITIDIVNKYIILNTSRFSSYGALFLYDSDGDGIDDENDDCPDDAETDNGYKDGDGCPDSVPVVESGSENGGYSGNSGSSTKNESDLRYTKELHSFDSVIVCSDSGYDDRTCEYIQKWYKDKYHDLNIITDSELRDSLKTSQRYVDWNLIVVGGHEANSFSAEHNLGSRFIRVADNTPWEVDGELDKALVKVIHVKRVIDGLDFKVTFFAGTDRNATYNSVVELFDRIRLQEIGDRKDDFGGELIL